MATDVIHLPAQKAVTDSREGLQSPQAMAILNGHPHTHISNLWTAIQSESSDFCNLQKIHRIINSHTHKNTPLLTDIILA